MIGYAKPPSRRSDVGTPSYENVITYTTSRIASGEWPSGHKLPTIVELSELTGCSQTAVKTALMLLHERGLVRGQQGKGNYVAERSPDG